jgi:hypothetical protein
MDLENAGECAGGGPDADLRDSRREGFERMKKYR